MLIDTVRVILLFCKVLQAEFHQVRNTIGHHGPGLLIDTMRVIHMHDLTRDQNLLFYKVLQSGPLNKFKLEGRLSCTD